MPELTQDWILDPYSTVRGAVRAVAVEESLKLLRFNGKGLSKNVALKG